MIAIFDVIIPMVVAFAAVVWLLDRYLVNSNQHVIFSLFMARSMDRRTATSAAQFLLPDAIVAELKATTRADAINKSAEIAAPRLDEGRQRQILDGAMAREHDFGTAIGDGVVIIDKT